MIINGGDLGFSVPGAGLVKKAAKVAVKPAAVVLAPGAAVSAVAARKVIGAVAGGAPASGGGSPVRSCGFGDRLAMLFGAKDRGCMLPDGTLAGDVDADHSLTWNATDENAIANYVRRSGGLTGKDNRPGALNGLGIAPLVAAVLAPVAVAGAKAVANKLAPKESLPACTFWQRFGRVFGGTPKCK